MPRRIAFLATPAVANGAQSGDVNVASFDDFQQRTLKGVRFVVPTAGLRYQIKVAGRLFADLDSSTFNAAGPTYDLDQTYPQGVQFQVNVVNGSGGAVPANAGIEFLYDASSATVPQ